MFCAEAENRQAEEEGIFCDIISAAVISRLMALWFTANHSGSSTKDRAIFTPLTH